MNHIIIVQCYTVCIRFSVPPLILCSVLTFICVLLYFELERGRRTPVYMYLYYPCLPVVVQC